ncbi:hypothetical protein [Thermohalobacter berrensis]|uniref:Uncharacterized protein n=1 Tax=Thermohalobacter berrensis TaxID=99594 RepID=A0A419T165_9FIRM|nr:hypothetical protein [Thermohalobacter berrensis]RKD31215.1 hypothetical protein BET03_03550 [Thermohalobacter berrensis]
MLYIGLIFIINGLYLILSDVYDLKVLIKDREFIKKKGFKVDTFYELKVSVGLLSIALGIFSVLNYIYY